jgi:hypothetical protein
VCLIVCVITQTPKGALYVPSWKRKENEFYGSMVLLKRGLQRTIQNLANNDAGCILTGNFCCKVLVADLW